MQQHQQQEETSVFVGNLSYSTTEATLADFFSTVGAVQRAKVLVFNDTQRPKGAAVVTFQDAGAAQRAVQELDGSNLDGRQIHLRPYYTNAPPPRVGGGRGRGDGGFVRSSPGVVVTVSNLPFNITWRELKDTFNTVAPVMRADTVARGQGTVSFSTMDEATTALQHLQGADLGGRPMSLRIAR